VEVLFCRPRAPQAIEDRLELEADALDELRVPHHLIAMEDVVDGDPDAALASLGTLDEELLYRGWMLTGEEYAALDSAVADRGGSLITSPEAYEAAHYLPNWIDTLSALTVPTRWIVGTDLGEAYEAAQALGPPPYAVKDHQPIDLIGRPQDDLDDGLDATHDLTEYINAHEEVGFHLQERRFHICRAHILARRVIATGSIPANFICSRAVTTCPFMAASASVGGRRIILTRQPKTSLTGRPTSSHCGEPQLRQPRLTG
jgi:hypothetical protein